MFKLYLLASALLTVSVQGKVCNVRDYGALDDGSTLNTEHIQQAIHDCAGGTQSSPNSVVFNGGGTFLTGSITLVSHLIFSVESGTVLLGAGGL